MFYDLIDRYCNWLFGDEGSSLLGAMWRALVSAIVVLLCCTAVVAVLHSVFPVTMEA